jgi:predicted amidophosphoribosyltransferase
VPWGSHFCANCGRPVGGQPVVACESCGHPLPADAQFCAACGKAAGSESEQPEAEAAAVGSADEPKPDGDRWEP